MYRNYLQTSEKTLFKNFVKKLDNLVVNKNCDMCGEGYYLNDKDIQDLIKNHNGKNFIARIGSFNIVHNTLLGSSLKESPNIHWSLNYSMKLCHLCSYFIIHHHIAFTPLSDGSEIFIDAPSFRIMYYLNKFAREIFGTISSDELRNKRNILAMSIIEYATRIQTTLGIWTGMNIEVISRRGGKIEFFSLPYEVIQLLSDRRIAELLSRIGEFTILNYVLNQDFSRFIEIGYRLLRIGLKPFNERGESEKEFVNQLFRLGKNRQDLAYVAEQLFHLYALIEEKLKRR